MKGLLLKDLYNLLQNLRSMGLMLVIFSFCFIPTAGAPGMIAWAAILGTMMVSTAVALDDHCKWNRYALVMPVSRKTVVAAKYLLVPLLGAIGTLAGLVIGTAGEWLLHRAMSLPRVGELLLTAWIIWGFACAVGGMVTLLVLRFGAEKGRLFVLAATAVPVGLVWGVWKLLELAGVVLTEKILLVLACAAPAAALLFDFGLYVCSCHMFDRKEID